MTIKDESLTVTRNHILGEVKANTDGSFRLSSSMDMGLTRLNPGLAAGFPWVSKLAALYELYEMLSFEVTYQPVSSVLAGGDVVWYIDYEVDGTQPQSVNDMFQ